MRLTEAEYAALVQKRAAFTKREQPRKLNKGNRWCDLFAAQLGEARIAHSREYKFLPHRRFRFDFALHLPRLAVEIDGVVHRIKSRFNADREKGNLALLAGWRVLHFSPGEVRSGEALALLQQALAPWSLQASA